MTSSFGRVLCRGLFLAGKRGGGSAPNVEQSAEDGHEGSGQDVTVDDHRGIGGGAHFAQFVNHLRESQPAGGRLDPLVQPGLTHGFHLFGPRKLGLQSVEEVALVEEVEVDERAYAGPNAGVEKGEQRVGETAAEGEGKARSHLSAEARGEPDGQQRGAEQEEQVQTAEERETLAGDEGGEGGDAHRAQDEAVLHRKGVGLLEVDLAHSLDFFGRHSRRVEGKDSGLFESAHAQHAHLVFREVAPVAALDVLLGQAGKVDAVELEDVVAQAGEDAAHDAIFAGVDFDAHLLAVGVAGVVHGIGTDVAVFEGDALGNLSQIGGRDIAVEVDVVNLLLQELGVRQFRGHFAVVGQEEDTRGVAVEAADGIDALHAGIAHEVHHSLAVLRIFARGDIALRFVEENVDFLLSLDLLVVEEHHVAAQDFVAQFGDDFAVDGHDTGSNVFVGIAAGAHTSVGQKLVQADGLVGVVSLLFIVDAALAGIEVFVAKLAEAALLGPSVAVALALVAAVSLVGAGCEAVRRGLIMIAGALLVAALTVIAALALIAFALSALSAVARVVVLIAAPIGTFSILTVAAEIGTLVVAV